MEDRRPIRIDIETRPSDDLDFATFARLAALAAYESAEDGMAGTVADERYGRASQSRYPGAGFTRQMDQAVPSMGLGARIRVIAWRDGG